MSVRAVNTDPIPSCGVPERAKGVRGDDVHIAISSGHIGASHNRTQGGVRSHYRLGWESTVRLSSSTWFWISILDHQPGETLKSVGSDDGSRLRYRVMGGVLRTGKVLQYCQSSVLLTVLNIRSPSPICGSLALRSTSDIPRRSGLRSGEAHMSLDWVDSDGDHGSPHAVGANRWSEVLEIHTLMDQLRSRRTTWHWG